MSPLELSSKLTGLLPALPHNTSASLAVTCCVMLGRQQRMSHKKGLPQQAGLSIRARPTQPWG